MRSPATRLALLESWKERVQTEELPSILETIKTEIPAHYTKRIKDSEQTIMLQLGNLIDEKLDKRFGWQSRMLESLASAVLIAIVLFGLGLL